MAKHKPNPAELINRAVELHRGNQIEAAEKLYREALALEPFNADALNLLGVIERQRENYAEAITLLEQAVAKGKGNPNLADFHNNLGECYRAQCQFVKALDSYDRALKLRPRFDSAIYNKGNLLQQTAHNAEAIACYEQVLAINPHHVKAQFAISISELLLENFSRGWSLYQWRLRTKPAQFPVPNVSTFIDAPPDLQGKRLLLVHEQGLGDEIFFLRFLPRLRELGAQVSYWPSDKLRPLLAATSTLTLADQNTNLAQFDLCFSVSDAALLARMTRVEDIPGNLKLKLNSEIANPLANIGVTLPRPWIGISWRAGTTGSYFKQVPLELLLQVFPHFTGTLFILQRNPNPEELALIQSELPQITSIDCSDLNDDLCGALWLLNQLDHYVCVSNTNLHLRHCLRKRCEVLAPVAGDFRWPNTRDNSPWFSNCPVYHQQHDGDWLSALGEVQHSLGLRT